MKDKVKIIAITVGVLVFLLIIATVVTMVVRKNYERALRDYSLEEIVEKDYKYFLAFRDNKYGVIDSQGNTVVDANYDKIAIPNPRKAVFICSNEGDEKNTILNEKKERIFENYDNVEEIGLEGLITSLPYEKSVLKYKENGKYGLIDFDGNKIVKATYEEIKGLKYKEGELLAKLDGKYGVINIKGAKIINFDYDNIEADKYYTEGEKHKKSGYIICITTKEGYRYGYISNKGTKMLDPIYNDVKRVTDIKGEDIYIIASKNGQYGLLKNKEELIDFKYQAIEYNDANNLLIINKGTKYGVRTLTGKEIVPIDYKTIQFNGIYIYAKTGSDVKYFTTTGEEVTTDYTSLEPVNNGEYYISVDKNGLYGVVDKDKNVLIENKFVYIEYLFDDYFSAYKNGSGLGIINTNGKEITDFKYTIINKISDTALVKLEDMASDMIQIYSKDLVQIAKLDQAELQIRDEYVKLINDDKSIFIDNSGSIIDEDKALEITKEAPDIIGEYTKEYMGYSQIYYTNEKEEIGENIENE